MKKLLAVLLSVCMLVCLLSACGPSFVISTDITSSDQTDDNQDATQDEENEENEEDSEDESENEEEPSEDEENSEDEEEPSEDENEEEEEENDTSSEKSSSKKSSSKKSSSKGSSKKESSKVSSDKDDDDKSSSEKSSSKKSSSKKSSSKKSSSKKSSSKVSSNKESSDKGSSDVSSSETKVNVADFDGYWTLNKGKVDVIKITAKDKTVTAYDSNGYLISTFPVVETEDGLVLKMGEVGTVTLKEASGLSSASEPSVSKDPAYLGSYAYVGGDLPADTALEIKDDGKYELTGSKADHGPYKYKNMTVTLTPTIELLYDVDYKIVGGGKVLYAVTDGGNKVRVFIKSDASGEAKAVANQCYIKSFEWKATDGSMTIAFNDNGRVEFGGEEIAVYYPTEKGITVEYTDGSTEDIEIKDGKFSLDFFGKTFEK